MVAAADPGEEGLCRRQGAPQRRAGAQLLLRSRHDFGNGPLHRRRNDLAVPRGLERGFGKGEPCSSRVGERKEVQRQGVGRLPVSQQSLRGVHQLEETEEHLRLAGQAFRPSGIDLVEHGNDLLHLLDVPCLDGSIQELQLRVVPVGDGNDLLHQAASLISEVRIGPLNCGQELERRRVVLFLDQPFRVRNACFGLSARVAAGVTASQSVRQKKSARVFRLCVGTEPHSQYYRRNGAAGHP